MWREGEWAGGWAKWVILWPAGEKEWAGGVWCGAGPERVLARAQVSFLPFYFLFFIFLYSNLIQIHI